MENNIYSAILASLQMLCQAYIPAAILGIGIGIVIGNNNIIYEILKRVLQIPASIPAIALLPIALIQFKDNLSSVLFLIFFSAIWQIAINTATGVRKSRREENGMKVAIEHIFTGLRIGIGLAWFTVIAAEILVGGRGIGFFIWDAYNSNETEQVLKGVLYIAIIGFLLDGVLDLAGYLVMRPFASDEKNNL
ncbi:ABC transporter permease subunit [Planktothrix sp. FACHB-1355]|uniref:ABC transporter permease subunit n=1 Tax=Aerosakkonema funiforme FACHB-1375 TaxID=2949571 RepID=A0A926ZI43_9CYAN|nr:ABC transporter permease subunit [Aerosakkonema funiforme FACHB-1375]MBD3562541.1 ABC transporter permease subunit [Planktothrix sp. FACHB-1355]